MIIIEIPENEFSKPCRISIYDMDGKLMMERRLLENISEVNINTLADVLTKAGYKVEVIYNIAPKQPEDIKTPNGVERIVQYGSDKDIVAPQSPMPGDVEQGGGPETDGKIKGHFLESYKNIFNIKKGQDGYVAPRKDQPKNE